MPGEADVSLDKGNRMKIICKACGNSTWRSVTEKEPIDRTGIWTYETKPVEYRVCTKCGHKERV